MKIELTELAPYLPYGVKCLYLRNGLRVYDDPVTLTVATLMYAEAQDWTPILKPMSDLTRPELEAAGFEDHIDFLTNEYSGWVMKYTRPVVIKETPYGHMQYLLANHYDPFGLIAAGKAINIHTLKDIS